MHVHGPDCFGYEKSKRFVIINCKIRDERLFNSSLPKLPFLSSLFSILSSLFFFFISQSTKLFFIFFSFPMSTNLRTLLFSFQIAAPFSLNLLLTSFSFRLFPIFLSLPILSTQQISPL